VLCVSAGSVYPQRALSADDLRELRELHAAQFGTLQEREALQLEGAEEAADDRAETIVLFLAQQSSLDIKLFVTTHPASHTRGVITTVRCGSAPSPSQAKTP
jgi:hypothetical protein